MRWRRITRIDYSYKDPGAPGHFSLSCASGPDGQAARRHGMAKTFLGLRFEREIDLADKRPFAKGAEIPGYKAEVYRSYDKSVRVGGLSFAIDSGRQDKALQEGRTLQVGRRGPEDRREGHVRRRGPRGDDRAVRARARGEARPGRIARVEASEDYLHE